MGARQDLHAILRTRETPVIGVAILVVQDIGYVLDINLAPDLAVHLVTDPPRHLAPAVLDSGLAKDRRAESVYT